MSAPSKLGKLNNPLWGCSVALSWTWGLGLFFSVQMAIQFGLGGLLAFAIPNAIGLAAFGWMAETISKQFSTSLEFEKHFLHTVGPMRWIFLLYQVVAIALTVFALFKYVAIPLGVDRYMVALIVLGAGLLLGEQFSIGHLKWSHFAMAVVILGSVLLIGWGGASYFHAAERMPQPFEGHESILSWKFGGFFVPILVGFLLGPWLDIQQWQRAIQIRREQSNIRTSYLFGGAFFFLILLFHGTLALSLWTEARDLGIEQGLLQQAADGLFHAKDFVVRFLFLAGLETPAIFRIMYVIFLCLCVVSTLDSGYVALKWFQTDALKKSESVLVSLIPKSFMESPIPPFVLATAIGLVALPMGVELEYFMAFYGSFSVGYSIVFLFRTLIEPRFTAFTQTTLVSLAAASLGIFGLGYLKEIPPLMILGAVIPLVHATVCIATRKAVEEVKKTGIVEQIADRDIAGAVSTIRQKVDSVVHPDRAQPVGPEPVAADGAMVAKSTAPLEAQPDPSPLVSASVGGSSSWVDGKWFVHKTIATYQDTNSVGNVYFGQYAMWVGKTRELFFRHALPGFDLKTTAWFILTRSFEHKFLHESREFDEIEIRIRISGFNRKFVTMEHEIMNSARKMLGKGKQVILFVSAKDYGIIDIPADCHKAFLPYL